MQKLGFLLKFSPHTRKKTRFISQPMELVLAILAQKAIVCTLETTFKKFCHFLPRIEVADVTPPTFYKHLEGSVAKSFPVVLVKSFLIFLHDPLVTDGPLFDSNSLWRGKLRLDQTGKNVELNSLACQWL